MAAKKQSSPNYVLPQVAPDSPMGKFTQAMKQIVQVPKETKKK